MALMEGLIVSVVLDLPITTCKSIDLGNKIKKNTLDIDTHPV